MLIFFNFQKLNVLLNPPYIVPNCGTTFFILAIHLNDGLIP